MSLPYYPMYPRDFHEGTLRMSLELKGAYIMLLNLIYTRNGPVDDEDGYLARYVGCSIRKWQKLRLEMIGLGKIVVENGLIRNSRADEELLKRRSYQDQQRENRSRPNKINDEETPPKTTRAKPEPESEPIEEKEEAIASSKKPDAKGSRLPPDWELPDDWLTDASGLAFKANQPTNPQEIRNEADKFRDYWTAKPGAAGRKLDWRGTWRNWFRSYLDRRPKPRNAPGSYGPTAFSEHGRSSIADVVIRRRMLRENGNGVSDEPGRGHDVPAEANVIDGQYRRVG